MCAILLSINPEHVKNILNGTKEYEFRKSMCKRHIDKILIYSTYPIMRVVGEADVETVLVDTPERIWKKTKNKSGIDKKFFDKYYEDKRQAIAYKLRNVMEYGEPRGLEYYGIENAPQSFRYVEML